MKLQNLIRRRSRKRRGHRCCVSGGGCVGRTARFEPLEPRHLLSGNPTVLAQDPDGLSTEAVSKITLTLSEPVVGDDARDAANYSLTHLGADRLPGGDDDLTIRILPGYIDGTTQIDIATIVDLGQWTEIDYGFPGGIFGDWQLEDDGASVKQYADGGMTFFVSDFDLLGSQFTGRVVVEQSGDDDFIGIVFGFQQHPQTGLPDSYYLVSCKQAASGGAEEGLKLVKVTGTGTGGNRPDLWDLESTDPHVEVLAVGPAVGWQDQTEYDFQLDYQSDGSIGLSIAWTTDGQEIWSLDYTDPSPLGGGKVGFYNFSQPAVRYTNLSFLDPLADGWYELAVHSGDPGLRDLEGNFLDGDGDGTGGDDYIGTFGIDSYTPAVSIDLAVESDSGASGEDNITNVTTPTFQVTVNKIGRVELDFDGDETVDLSQLVAGGGTYEFAGSYGSDATYSVAVDFLPASGDTVHDVLEITIDTAAPELLPGAQTADAPWSEYNLTFNEPIDAATFDTGDVAFSSPLGDPLPVNAVSGNGAEYVVSFPYQVAGGNYTFSIGPGVSDLAGNSMSAAAEVMVGLNADEFGPEVTGATIEPDTITVTYFDGGGMDADTVIDVSNYTLLASGGDGSFEEGNETDLSSQIGIISFDAETGAATLPLLAPLADEQYQLSINGTPPSGVRDLSGNYLLEGAGYAAELPLDTQPASVLIDLQPGSDSGVSDTDNITNVQAPAFEVTVNEAGLIEVDYQGDGTFDDSLLAYAGGTHPFVAPTLADDTYSATARFTPAAGSTTQDVLMLTVDTQGPGVLPGPGTAEAPWREQMIHFDEPIYTSSLAIEDVTLSGPAGAVDLIDVQPSGGGYLVSFDYQVAPGDYTFLIGPDVADPAGNSMDEAAGVAVALEADLVGPNVLDFVPVGPGNQDISQLTVTFNEPMLEASFEKADIAVSGPGGPLDSESFDISRVNETTFEIAIPNQSQEGDYLVTLGPGVTDLSGNEMSAPVPAAYQAVFTIDKTGPIVAEMTPSGIVGWVVDSVSITLDGPIDPASFDIGDISLLGPDAGSIAVLSLEPGGEGAYQFTFEAQRANGTYGVTVGPEVIDQAGNQMDAAFTGEFTISLPDLTLDPNDPDSVDIPALAQFGETIGVAWKVLNTGTATAEGSWSDRVWLSEDTVLDDGDILLGSEPGAAPVAPAGTYTGSTPVTLPLSESLAEGTYFVLVQTGADSTLVEADGENNTLAEPIELSLPPLPDLAASDIAAPATAMPGEQIALSWKVGNQGAVAATGSWTEAIYLSADGTIGDDFLVTTFIYEGPIEPGPAVDRSETITVPDYGVAGNLWFVVRVDSGAQIVEQQESNNSAIDDAMINVPTTLTLSLPAGEVSEDDANPVMRAVVSRSGDLGSPLVVTLQSDDTTELTVPSLVTIPADQHSVAFEIDVVDDEIADGPQTVTIQANATGFAGASGELTVTDTFGPSLTLELGTAELTEGDVIMATITRDGLTDQPLEVSFATTLADQVELPESVTIEAGQPSAGFELIVTDDEVSEPEKSLNVTAYAPDYTSSSVEVDVIDDDEPTLSLELDRASVSEGAGASAVVATVRRDVATDVALTVSLESSDTTEAAVPAEVVIPAGEDSVAFLIAAVDDDMVDGAQMVTISAVGVYPSCGCQMEPTGTGVATAELEVTDDDGPTLRVVIDKDLVPEGQTAATSVTVYRNTGTVDPLEITLVSNDPDELTVPAGPVIIPAQSDFVTFNVDTADDGVPDGNKLVTITASADGFTAGADTVIVTDVDLPDLVISELAVPPVAETEQFFDITYRMANEGLIEAVASNAEGEFPGSWTQRVFLSYDEIIGGDLLLATFEFVGTMPVGGYIERTIPVRAPLNVGDYWIVATADVAGTVTEGIETNNTTISDSPVHVEAGYTATVQTDVEVTFTGTPIPFAGQTADRDTGVPVPYAMVNIHLDVRGTTRVISAIADDAGEFSATFTPLPGEGGLYTIGAAHPGEATAPVQDSFTLLGMRAEPPEVALEVYESDTAVGQFTLYNLADVPLTGVSCTVIDAAGNLDVEVTLPDPDTLPGLAAWLVDYEITALDASLPQSEFTIRVDSDQGAWVEVPVEVEVEAFRPRLVADVDRVEAAMLRGESRVVAFGVANQGAVESGEITVTLPQAPWLSLASDVMPSLAPGEFATVSLVLTPAADEPFGVYDGNLLLTGGNDALLSVPFQFRVVSDAVGDLAVTVVDEYYYYAEGAPKVADAAVQLLDPITSEIVYEDGTNADGEFVVSGLQENYYELRVQAEGHYDFVDMVFVAGGTTTEIFAFVPRQTVRYSFDVTPTEIEDRTQIIIETVFETNVPYPVLTLDPATIDVSEWTTAYTQIDVTITNHGLIAAQDVEFYYEKDHSFYEMSPLVDYVGVIPAKSSVTVPVLFRRLVAGESAPGGPVAEGSSSACGFDAGVRHIVICGIPIEYSTGMGFTGLPSGCNPVHVTPPAVSPGPGTTIHPHPFENRLGARFKDCDDCLKSLAEAAALCALGFTPACPALAARTCYRSVREGGPLGGWGDCGIAVAGCIPVIGPAVSTFDCIRSIGGACLEPIPPEGDPREGAGMITVGPLPVGGRVGAALAVVLERGERLGLMVGMFESFYGDDVWLYNADDPAGAAILQAYHESTYTDHGDGSPVISAEEQQALLDLPRPDGVSEADVIELTDYWNRTYAYGEQGIFHPDDVPEGENDHFLALDVFVPHLDTLQEAQDASEAEGFQSLLEGCKVAIDELNAVFAELGSAGGACAAVRIEISQDAVMTRDAFDARLVLENSSGTDLIDIGASIRVTDVWGVNVTDLFGIHPPSLNGFSAVDGTGTVTDTVTGTASWLIVPTTDAAPLEPTEYFVSGTLFYTESETVITIPLAPQSITVYPQAELHLDYFHQRDVFSDDPWTDEVEPAEPFALAVMVQNDGAGEARNLRITSAQPEIVENEKGLLIDFKIIASQVAGQNLEPSLRADFGNIAPGEIKIGQWLLTSTLQGQFISYDASFEHVDGLGDPRLSLIKSVEIHELIHIVSAYGDLEDGMPDFLVNEVIDPDDLPDTLYLSDGTVEIVSLALTGSADGPVTQGDLEVELTTDMLQGWNYLRMPDPGGSDYRVVRVERDDGVVLPAENVWQTDRTFIELGRRPIDEDNLHLFDYNPNEDPFTSYTYTLTYQPRDQFGPVVIELEDPGDGPLTEPVASLQVTFSEPVDAASFDWADLLLTRDGGPNLITGDVTIQHVEDATYQINGLAPLTEDGGQYTLTVNAAGIVDLWDNPGTGTAARTWLAVSDSPGVATVDGVPPAVTNTTLSTIEVTFTESLQGGTFTLADLSLTRDGGPNLIGTAQSITQTGQQSYQIGPFTELTTDEGLYELRVDATGVEDPDGNPGIGQASFSWTMDTTGPTVEALGGLPGTAVNTPVESLQVEFSEAIETTSFDVGQLSLSLDAGPNLLTAREQLVHVAGNTYRITGLSALTAADGQYELTFGAGAVRDPAGNPGTAAASVQWTMDTVEPEAATNLAISPDTGASATDGKTNSLSLTVTGQLAEPGLSVQLSDLTTGTELCQAAVTDLEFSGEAAFAAAGAHRIRARVADAAGNSADSFFDIFIDVSHPTVEDVDVPLQFAPDGSDEITVAFSEPMDIASMIADGSILSAVSLMNLAAGPVTFAADQFAYDEPTWTLGVSLSAFEGNLPGGNYELGLDGSLLADMAGNPMRGGSGGRVTFSFPAFAPAQYVAAGGADINVEQYSVPSLADWNADGLLDLVVGEKTNTGEGKVRVYLNGGTASAPSFGVFSYAQSESADLSVAAAGCLGVFPRVYDYDQDGRKDLLVGLADGRVQVFMNTNTDADPQFGPAEFVEIGQPGDKQPIDVGSRATLDVVDWNNDGRFDLVTGSIDGRIRVLLDEAETGPKDFRSELLLADGSGGDLLVPGGRSSVAVVDLDDDGRKDLVVGNTDGQVLFYANCGTDSQPSFDQPEPLRAGGAAIDLPGTPRSRPFVADYNDDGIPDILLGAADGLVRLYVGQADPATGEEFNDNNGPPGGVYTYSAYIAPAAGIVVQPKTGLQTVETGATDSFTVVLKAKPTAEVTINLASSDETEGTVSPESLTFTPDDWDQPQTVTVAGVDDEEADGGVAYMILTAPAVSDDPNYDGLDASDVSVVNVDDDAPPQVKSVIVFGSGWAPEFPYSGGYAIPAGSADQLAPLPWSGINRVRIVFSEDVAVAEEDLSLRSTRVNQYAFSGFDYDPVTFTATWSLAGAIGGEKLLLHLSDDVHDQFGDAMDGEWASGSSTFPSGNGAAGGDFRFFVNVLPADANQDGKVNDVDAAMVVSNWQAVGSGNPQADFNGDNRVNDADAAILVSHWQGALPIPGDANLDGMVNDQDTAIVATNWQAADAGWSQGDFNWDRQVTDADIAILAGNWQQGTGEGSGPVRREAGGPSRGLPANSSPIGKTSSPAEPEAENGENAPAFDKAPAKAPAHDAVLREQFDELGEVYGRMAWFYEHEQLLANRRPSEDGDSTERITERIIDELLTVFWSQ